MRTRLVVDSATPAEIYNLTLAFQRTSRFDIPGQLTVEPTVTVCGNAMGWTSPALNTDRAIAMLAEYDKLNN